jgi:hypothetical protein
MLGYTTAAGVAYRGGKIELRISSVGVNVAFSSVGALRPYHQYQTSVCCVPVGVSMNDTNTLARASFVVDTNMGLSYRTSDVCGANIALSTVCTTKVRIRSMNYQEKVLHNRLNTMTSKFW